MKKRNKKKIGLIIGIISVLLIFISVSLLFLFQEDKKTSLTILEKRWIEDNKNKIIDMGITYDIPIYTLTEESIVFNFLNDLEKNTGLEFNKVPYELSKSIEQEYYFSNVNTLPETPYILLDSTNYVLLTKQAQEGSNEYTKVGVLNQDKEEASYYLSDMELKEYDSYSSMKSEYENGLIQAMLLPYSTYLKSILELKDTVISKKITEMKQYYILNLGKDNKKLNSIIKKYYEKWKSANKTKQYNELLISLYYTSKEINKQQINQLNSKNYTYGYVENLPYEGYIDNEMHGIVGKYLNDFSNITDVDFEFKSFKSVEDLKEAIEKNKVDISFGYYNVDNEKVNKTQDIGNTNYVVLTYMDSDLIVNSPKSLKNKEVSIIKDTSLRDYLIDNSKATLKEYNTLKSLLEAKSKDAIIVLDEKTYEYYSDTLLDGYKVAYRSTLPSQYRFYISNTEDNKLFEKLFDYYLSFTDDNSKIEGYNSLLTEKNLMKNSERKYFGYVLILMVTLIVIIGKILRTGRINKQNKREEKIRYVDMLTSLKNRNYLNSHMSEWNENTVYPQAVIVIDLNNIKYINDNYGYEEGDNVIGMAANILINTQLENTDIIRTDGNEFLIYMVGYDDKKVITYMRKLYKELQQLPHEFGAALGYSMIEDDIKTIDDAINEATLDMRKNKETLE